MRNELWEAEFKTRGVNFTYLPIIDRETLLRDDQTRVLNGGSLTSEEDHVLGIALHLEEGGTVWPFMVEQVATGPYRLLDGYNRDAAMRLRDEATHQRHATPHDAYALTFDNMNHRDTFVETVNIWTNGREISKEHRRQRAIQAMYSRGLNARQAAAAYQLKQDEVSRLKKISDHRQRLAGMGIDTVRLKLSDAHCEILGAERRDAVVKIVSRAFEKRTISLDDLRLVMRKTRDARSDAEAITASEAWLRRVTLTMTPETTTRRKSVGQRPPLLLLLSQIEWMERTIAKVHSGKPLIEHVKIVQPVVLTLIEQLSKLDKELRRLKRQSA